MRWLTHGVTGRAHAFERSDKVSDCGLNSARDCAQQPLFMVEERVDTAVGAAVIQVPRNAACHLCRRAVVARLRRAAVLAEKGKAA